ncbi:DUF4231 domain-containing protein [Christensenellaceae bacterium OttesenSCG-928-K19]|nr:DUF4231 domain-containing protein [Christensenellaceae bacterium OttesenSCG-928-K19]
MGGKSGDIPLVVGITGHRDISTETQQKLYEIAHGLFSDLRARYPHTPVHVLCSLAVGADTVCARAALAAGCELIVPLPMPEEEYRKDFSKEELVEFDALLERAACVFESPWYERSEITPQRGFYYRQAGIYVTRHSHLLFACWDGEETLFAGGGGTYETVRFMREQPFSQMEDAGFEYSGGMVLQVVTPRQDTHSPKNPFQFVLMDGPECSVQEKPIVHTREFAYVDGFNHDCEKYGTTLQKEMEESQAACVDSQAKMGMDAEEAKMLHVYVAADAMAVHFQKRRVLALRLLAVLGLLFVLFFLFYDELESPPMLAGYGALIVIAAICYLFFTKKRFHDKYVLYRVLAEAIRIQLYMEAANLREFAFHIPWWKQNTGLRFVEDTCRILRKTQWDGLRPCDAGLLERCWITPQLAYHNKAMQKKGGKNKWNGRVAQILLVLAVLFFVIVAVIEGWFPWVMGQRLPNFFKVVFPFLQDTLTWSAIFKIILGTVSAAAAFLANYYGKLALAEQVRGSKRMYRLYGESKQKLEAALREGRQGDARRILLLLANAALEENLDWYTYNVDNAPEFLIG